MMKKEIEFIEADKIKKKKKNKEVEFVEIGDEELQSFTRIMRKDSIIEKPAFLGIGNGFYTCYRVHRFNDDLPNFWLTQFAYLENVYITIDIKHEKKDIMRSAVKKATTKNHIKLSQARDYTSRKDASDNIYEAQDAYNSMKNGAEGVKSFTIRFHIFGKTFEELGRNVNELEKKLLTKNIVGSIPANSLGKEINFLKHSNTVDILSATSALGNSFPFHFQEFIDDNAPILGYSSTEGVIAIDFTKNDQKAKRVSYDITSIGAKGGGKSVGTKVIISNEHIMGHKNIILDPENEYSSLVKKLGGETRKTSGDDAITFNPLEVRVYGDDLSNRKEFFESHKYNVAILIGIFNRDLKTRHYQLITDRLGKVYNIYHINENTDTANMKSKDFPILEELLEFFEIELEIKKNEMPDSDVLLYKEIISTLHLMVDTYGNYFNRHSNFDDVKNTERLVNFELKNIARNNNNAVLQGMMFIILFVYVTTEMEKNKIYNDNRKSNEPRIFLRVTMDEAHLVLNESNPEIVAKMNEFMKLFRKYTAGLHLITQSLLDFHLKSSTEVANNLKKIFDESKYKFIYMQNPESYGEIKKRMSYSINELDIEKIQKFSPGNFALLFSNRKLYGKAYLTAKQKELFSSENLEESKEA